ncbi:GlsB/YeaQ/YmgE family stress response membrane protein [Neorhodopirellula pilleata]|nr:GlsB/YeaQ/YmgE family stress response membrane protein [Neorhodopirellula pilleata]
MDTMFWLIGWIVFGFVVGLIARALMPGTQPLGFFRTMLLGVAGSFIGGLIGFFIVGGSLIQSSGWIGSIIGAVILLALQIRRGRIAA